MYGETLPKLLTPKTENREPQQNFQLETVIKELRGYGLKLVLNYGCKLT